MHVNNPKPLAKSALLNSSSLLLAAVCWGVVWYPYRILANAGVAAVASSFYCYSTVLILAGIVCIKHWRGIFKLPVSILWLSLTAGWTNLAYVLAVIDGEVMRVMLLFYLSPLWTLILAHFWLKERIDKRGLMIMALSLTGAFIMLSDLTGKSSAWPLPRNTAEWFALTSGIAFAISNVITRKSTHLTIRSKSFAVWAGVFLIAILAMPFVNETIPSPSFFSLNDGLVILAIALSLIAATLLTQYGITQMPATRASVLFLFELVVAAITSYFLAHETMEINEWIGGSLIAAASIFAALNHHD
ncbi:DMT family transporter [Methylotenera sp.]|uniref:DMT family transporter n=1 Tax=Methylotenera sp. TaxID=2051956 RepID=UPI0024883395|nr:DMT family transporter [Methylotenera sp.]MDI1362452.1 DMT family transporter [Methylotenera sp.]